MQMPALEVAIGVDRLPGHLVAPAPRLPGVLLVHGWDSSQAHYQSRSEEIAALGCVCLSFDLRGHGRDAAEHASVSREDNLRDVLAAYDVLAAQPAVDPASILIAGTSYGGYLAAIASALRPVRWLAMRVPALYPDEGWDVPKVDLDRKAIDAYRRSVHRPEGNRALSACARFRGAALVVASEFDDTVPAPAIESFARAFTHTPSLTFRTIAGADHALSSSACQQAYDMLFIGWLTQTLLAGRSADLAARA